MSIYTKTGDQGQTGLLGGQRVYKDDLRVETYGTIDEANSALGLAKSLCQITILKEITREIQGQLLAIGAELADITEQGFVKPCDQLDVQKVEGFIDQLEALKPPQKGFVLPGETKAAGAYDLARTIIRRAERRLISLNKKNPVNPYLLKYVNRLSDLFYVMARVDEHIEGLVKQITKEVRVYMETKIINMLNLAKELAVAAEEEAKNIGVPMVIAVVDKGGNLVLCQRMDDALLVSLDIAVNKAFTAVGVKIPTHEVAKAAQPGEPLYGIQTTNNGKIVIFGGGYPLYVDNELIGALGISGGSVEEDMQVAEAALGKVMGKK